VRASAILLALLGSFVALSALSFLLILLVLAWQQRLATFSWPGFRQIVTGTLLAAALTYLCWRAALALFAARRWAANVAIIWGILFLFMAGQFVFDLYHPSRQGPDEYFGLVLIPPIAIVGLWWCIYLNLPHVRRHLRRDASQP